MDQAERTRSLRLKRFGVETNWAVVGLTDHNTVEIDVGGERRDTDEPPSEWIGLEFLMSTEIAILRRGLTRGGRDRKQPRVNGKERR